MSLHTSINKVWIFLSWPWKRTLKDWIEKVTARLTPSNEKLRVHSCTSPMIMNGRFLSVNGLNFPTCLSRKMQPLWIKDGTNSNEKEATGTNGKIRRANGIPRKSQTIQLFRERLSAKVHATILTGIVCGFECTVLQRNWKNDTGCLRCYVCDC